MGPGGLKRSISRPNIPPPLPPPLPLPNPPAMQPSTTNGLSTSVQNQNQVSHLTSMNNGIAAQDEQDDDDDFDDSDFYDSDSELIRNFVAAVQPIYAMEEEPLYQYYTYGISLQVSFVVFGLTC